MSKNDKIKIALLLSLWVLAFIPVYPELISDWLGHSDNSHGFLVPLIAGYFTWKRKERLKSATIGHSMWGGVLLFIALAIYVGSYAGGLAFPARIALVLSLLGLIWCSLGREITRILAFPVLFLLFMIPLPYSLLGMVSLPMQLLATKISASLIQECSIPVYREGNMLFFVGTQLEVAESCSGIRSIMSMTMLAFVFASMLSSGWKKKAVLALSAVPIAMVANIIRIFGTGVLAHFFGAKVARNFLHEFSGIAIFIFGLVVLLGIFNLINAKKEADA